MPLRTGFTSLEREKLAVLVNNVSAYAVQILTHSPGWSVRALANLDKLKREREGLLKRLDKLAREQNEESPLRLVEDFARMPTDVAEALTMCGVVACWLPRS